ncbi:MAG: hypothetical protein WCG47_10410 [Dermatophilaceae bacterium]
MTTTIRNPRATYRGSIRGDFFTPGDRCGYRRGEQEVRLLLGDIDEAVSGEYFYLAARRCEAIGDRPTGGNWLTVSSGSRRCI